MSFRSALAPLTAISDVYSTASRALTVVKTMGAHLDAVFVRPDPQQAYAYTGLDTANLDIAIQEARDKVDEHGRAIARKAQRRFYKACEDAGVPRERSPQATGRASASWRQAPGEPAWVIPDIARAADVAIFTGAEARYNLLFENLLEATLLRSGIPVLLLPESLEMFTPERALIACDGDASCARAISSWLASGLASGPATIGYVSEPHEETPDFDAIKTKLAWHGVDAKTVVRKKHFEPVGEALLSLAEETGAGLVVMGGYGKSRYREALFGGVTRYVIRHACIPVLMMH